MTRRGNPLAIALHALLLAATLAMQAAVPHGWMVESDRHGRVSVVICHVEAMRSMSHHGGDHAANEGAQGKQCVFAGLNAGGYVPPGPVDLPLPTLALAAFDTTRARALAPATPRSLPPARGPPPTV